jgi:hypothetical protein
MSDEAHREHLEPGGVRTWSVTAFAAGIILLLIASIIGLHAWFAGTTPADRTPSVRPFPEPQLGADPAADLNAVLATQRAALNTYRWADKDHTLIAIPIARAMQLIAARGDKAYAPIESAAPAPADTPATAPAPTPSAGGKP